MFRATLLNLRLVEGAEFFVDLVTMPVLLTPPHTSIAELWITLLQLFDVELEDCKLVDSNRLLITKWLPETYSCCLQALFLIQDDTGARVESLVPALEYLQKAIV